jgi:hypothetical protein
VTVRERIVTPRYRSDLRATPRGVDIRRDCARVDELLRADVLRTVEEVPVEVVLNAASAIAVVVDAAPGRDEGFARK